jgi:putative effector of murein hydrolase
VALVAGSLTAALSAWGLGALFGASRESLMSLAPKSVTTPIAMAVAERLGGLPSLTAVLVISTGIIGAVGARYLFRWLHIDDHAVRGFAIGIASHGIGTARAFQVSEQAGAFAALAMGLNGLVTALSLPWIMPWVERVLGR